MENKLLLNQHNHVLIYKQEYKIFLNEFDYLEQK